MDHANKSNTERVKAFLDLDAQRYKIKQKLLTQYQLKDKEKQKFLEFHGVDRAQRGRAQFPEDGVHMLLTQNMDDKRERELAKRQIEENANTAAHLRLSRSAMVAPTKTERDKYQDYR